MPLADWDYVDHQMLLKGLMNDWKMFIRLTGVEEDTICNCITDFPGVEEQKLKLLDCKLKDCPSYSWYEVKKILKLLEKDELIKNLEKIIKSNGYAVEDEDEKGLNENYLESKTLMLFITAKHIASCWESISRRLGLNEDKIEFIQKSYLDPIECAYQALLRSCEKKDLQWDDIELALDESNKVPRYLFKKIKKDLKKHISSYQEKKDEQHHDILTKWKVIIISHTDLEDINELATQVDNTLNDTKNQKGKTINLSSGAGSKEMLNNDQWEKKCNEYIEKYYGSMDFFIFNYETEVPDSFKDFLEKNKPSFLIKDYSLYKHFELLGMLSSLQDQQVDVEELQRIKMDHIGFEATNKTIYFFKISNAKTVHDLKQDIDDCAFYVRMFLILHKNELEGIIACLMSFIVIPTEYKDLINDIAANVCKYCKQYIITMNEFLNFEGPLSGNIEDLVGKTTNKNWHDLKKDFLFKDFKYRMGTIFVVMASQEGNFVPNLSLDISKQFEKYVRILLYPQQLSIVNSDDKHVLLKGGYGSGKTIVGRILLKKIHSNCPKEIIYYINFAASSDFTKDMEDVTKDYNSNVICCDRTKFQNNQSLTDIISEIKRNHMPTSQIHLIFDEVSLDEFGEKDIISFCAILNQRPYQGGYCLIICQAMTKQRTLKENGKTPKSLFMDQTQILTESNFTEKTLNECLRYTAKIGKLVKIARENLELAINKFSNEEIEKKETSKKIPMPKKTDEDLPKSNRKQEPQLNFAINEVPSETDTLGEESFEYHNKTAPTPLKRSEDRVKNSVINFDADVKKVNPTPVNIINDGKIIESQFQYVKDSQVLHNIGVEKLPMLYFPFDIDKDDSFSAFEYVYLMMLCFKHLYESRYFWRGEKIVVIHLENETPVVLLKALKLCEELKIKIFENIEFKKLLDVQGTEYKNVIVFFSVAEYHMRHYLIEAITRCMCNLAFFIMKENWKVAKEEVLWKIIQTWIKSIDNEGKCIKAIHKGDLKYTDDDLNKFKDSYANKLDKTFLESSDDKKEAAENLAKAMKPFGIAKEDSDSTGNSNGDNGGSDGDDQNTPGSPKYRDGRKINKKWRKLLTEVEEAPGDPPQPDAYDMSTIPCGRCLIFNNEFPEDVTIVHEGNEEILKARLNSDEDVQRIHEIFTWLQFEVIIHANTKRDDMMKLLKEEAENESHNKSSCIVVFILSYGREARDEATQYYHGGVYTADGLFCSMIEIIEIFKAYKTKNPLKNKPKLFFLQASPPKKRTEEYKDDSWIESRLIPVDRDIFVRSSPYIKNWQWPDGGSMFIQILCNILQRKAGQYSLDDLMTVLNIQLSKRVTHMSGVFEYNTLSRQLRFNPSTTSFN